METKQCIFFQLAKASQAGSRHWNESVAEFGITGVQAMVLSFLAEEDSITSGSLGKLAQLDSATLTGILDRLERSKILSRKPNPSDRRAVLVCLTQKGKKIAQQVKACQEPENGSFLSHLTTEEAHLFRTLLQKILPTA